MLKQILDFYLLFLKGIFGSLVLLMGTLMFFLPYILIFLAIADFKVTNGVSVLLLVAVIPSGAVSYLIAEGIRRSLD